ncbi:VanZ family protein [Polaribacter sp. R77954]|uniref:VanZ family protein n=1 Tax=Polaribacter sp. R77954 TaxID=3093870 RepID=UPI0037C7063E
MLQRIKTLLLNNVLLFAIGVTVAILCLSLIKVSNVPSMDVKNIDKAYHSIAYFTLAITWLFSFYKKPQKKYTIVLLCISFGIIIEVLQSNLTAYRSGDLLDVLANSLGVLLALWIFNIFLKKNRIKSSS